MRSIVTLFALAAAALAGAADGGGFTIAVIPKGTTHEFWKSIHAGAVKAQRELEGQGVKITLIWKGPLKEDDRAGQIDVVQTFVGQGVSGMVLAPLDDKALVAPVELAANAMIPVVIIDSGLQTEKIASFVATNNFAGGQMAAARLGEILAGKGRVILLRYQEGSASTMQREAGFLDVMKSKFPAIKLVSFDQYAGATRDSAYTVSQNLLSRFGTEVDGIFTPNESSTAGMVLALKDAGLAGQVKHVGFDASPPLIDALKAGAIQGLVVQDPFDMGYKGVTFLVAHLQGKVVPKQVDTNIALVTPENIAKPEIDALIHPPLDQYLK